MTIPTQIQPDELPATIRDYLAAHVAHDVDAALRTLSPQVAITDEERTFRGADGALEFLQNAGSQFTYTTDLVGAIKIDAHNWVAINHLEGNFPGGVADLHFRFTMDDDLIAELVIAPDSPLAAES